MTAGCQLIDCAAEYLPEPNIRTMIGWLQKAADLRRGQTKTYSHGVRYLNKLDRLAKSISDWRNLDDHTVYMQQLRQTHGRKSSFWSRYEN